MTSSAGTPIDLVTAVDIDIRGAVTNLLNIGGEIVKADRASEIDAPCGNDRVILRMCWRAHKRCGNGGGNT